MLQTNIILLKQQYTYILFDFINHIMYGYAQIIVKDGYIVVKYVAAEHGHGPLIHDIIMMDNFPYDVRSDFELTEDEINIWRFYYNRRTDVKKYKIPRHYTIPHKRFDEESLLYSYTLEPTKEFLDYKKKSLEIIFENNINVTEIINDGEIYFDRKYSKVKWEQL